MASLAPHRVPQTAPDESWRRQALVGSGQRAYMDRIPLGPTEGGAEQRLEVAQAVDECNLHG